MCSAVQSLRLKQVLFSSQTPCGDSSGKYKQFANVKKSFRSRLGEVGAIAVSTTRRAHKTWLFKESADELI